MGMELTLQEKPTKVTREDWMVCDTELFTESTIFIVSLIHAHAHTLICPYLQSTHTHKLPINTHKNVHTPKKYLLSP